MNKIYRLKYNATVNQLVVVSELGNRKSKSSAKRAGKMLLTASALLACSSLLAIPAMAEDGDTEMAEMKVLQDNGEDLTNQEVFLSTPTSTTHTFNRLQLRNNRLRSNNTTFHFFSDPAKAIVGRDFPKSEGGVVTPRENSHDRLTLTFSDFPDNPSSGKNNKLVVHYTDTDSPSSTVQQILIQLNSAFDNSYVAEDFITSFSVEGKNYSAALGQIGNSLSSRWILTTMGDNTWNLYDTDDINGKVEQAGGDTLENNNFGRLIFVNGGKVQFSNTSATTWTPFDLTVKHLDASNVTFNLTADPTGNRSDTLTVNGSLRGINNTLNLHYQTMGTLTSEIVQNLVTVPNTNPSPNFITTFATTGGTNYQSVLGLEGNVWKLFTRQNNNPWNFNADRTFGSLFLNNVSDLHFSNPTPGEGATWTPRKLTTDNLTTNGSVLFTFVANPLSETPQNDQLIVKKFINGENNNIKVRYLGSGDLTKAVEQVIFTSPRNTPEGFIKSFELENAHESYHTVWGLSDGRLGEDDVTNWSLITMTTAAPWTLSGNRNFSSLTFNNKTGTVVNLSDASNPTSWTPTHLTVGTLDATDVTFNLFARPTTPSQAAQSDSITVTNVATGDNNKLNVSFLLNGTTPTVNTENLVLATAPTATPNSFFTGQLATMGMSVFRPNFEIKEEEGQKKWVLTANLTTPAAPLPPPPPVVDMPSDSGSPGATDSSPGAGGSMDSSSSPDAGAGSSPDAGAGAGGMDTSAGTDAGTGGGADAGTGDSAGAGTGGSAGAGAGGGAGAGTGGGAGAGTGGGTGGGTGAGAGGGAGAGTGGGTGTGAGDSPGAGAGTPTAPVVASQDLFTRLQIPLTDLDNAASETRIISLLQRQGLPTDESTVRQYQQAVGQIVQTVRRVENVASVPGIAFVLETNQLDKRLGDVRQLGASEGFWMKVNAGQARYQDLKLYHTTFQLGVDKKVGNNLYGIMGSYTAGHTSGQDLAERHTTGGFGLYYSYLPDEGVFVDVVGKYLSNHQNYDFPALSGLGSQSPRSQSLLGSVQVGYHAKLLDNKVFVEPSAELVAGHTSGYVMKGQDLHVQVNASNPLYAKLGASAGVDWQSGDKQVTLAAGLFRLQNLHKAGGVDLFDNNGSRRHNPAQTDSRYQASLSAFTRLSENWRLYAQAETSFGGNLKDDYSGQIGVRYKF